jgi:peptide deformylase
MAILKIARMGHPVLRGPAAAIADPTAPELRVLAADMIETLADAGGVGLAAPQVHRPLRLVIYFVPASRAEDGQDQPLRALVNPVLTFLGDAMESASEGCLSVPGLSGVVPRFTRLHYAGLGLDGKPIEGEAQGFHARVLQHECDHLDGILYPARIVDFQTFGFAEELRKPID